MNKDMGDRQHPQTQRYRYAFPSYPEWHLMINNPHFPFESGIRNPGKSWSMDSWSLYMWMAVFVDTHWAALIILRRVCLKWSPYPQTLLVLSIGRKVWLMSICKWLWHLHHIFLLASPDEVRGFGGGQIMDPASANLRALATTHTPTPTPTYIHHVLYRPSGV